MPQAALDSVRAVTFDMYGTLLDLETSFVQGFSQFLKAKGSALDAAEVVRASFLAAGGAPEAARLLEELA